MKRPALRLLWLAALAGVAQAPGPPGASESGAPMLARLADLPPVAARRVVYVVNAAPALADAVRAEG